jgi:Na+-driven multidrug efflux pump
LPADGSSIVAIAAAVIMSVIGAAAIFYGDRNKPDYAFRIIVGLAHLHVLFFTGLLLFFGRFSQTFMRSGPAENSIFYDGASYMWSTHWPWFILVTLVTISLVVYWGNGKALQLK